MKVAHLGRWASSFDSGVSCGVCPVFRNAVILTGCLMPGVLEGPVTCVSDNCPVRVAIKQVEVGVAGILANRQTAGWPEHLLIHPMSRFARRPHCRGDFRETQKPC